MRKLFALWVGFAVSLSRTGNFILHNSYFSLQLNEEDIQEFAITKAEFEEIWNTKIPMNRSAAEMRQE
jgi:hypothetical protein